MNTPNPLLPQGSLQGQAKGKSNFRIAVFTILAIHVVLICGFLIQGCKPDAAKVEPTVPEETSTESTNGIPPFADTQTSDPFPTNDATPDYGRQPTNVTGGAAPDPFGSTGAVVNSGITGAAPDVATSFTSAPAIPGGSTSAPQPGFNVETSTAPVFTGEMTTHSVAKGEMLSTIARKYRVTVRAIEEANPGLNPLRLQIGQKLNIPAAAATSVTSTTSTASADVGSESYTIYTVKSGDVLERIARNNNTTVSAIKAANGLKLDRINVGQKLKIPKKGQ